MSSVHKKGNRYSLRWRELADDGWQQHAESFATQREAERAQRRLDEQLRTGSPSSASNRRLTFGSHALTWLATRRTKRGDQLRPLTRERNRALWHTHIQPRWSKTAISDISPSDVQKWLSDLEASVSSKTGRPLSAATIKVIVQEFKACLNAAVQQGIIQDSPARYVTAPGGRPEEIKPLTADEIWHLADCVEPQRYRGLILVMGFCGLRISEATSLQLGSIDFERKRLKVTRTAIETSAGLDYSEPKTRKGRRSVPLTDTMLSELSKHVATYRADAEPDELLFTTQNGLPVSAQVFRRRQFVRACKAAGLKNVVPHHLRHSAASLMIANGYSLLLVQRILGHEQFSTTAQIYGHVYDADYDEPTSRFNESISRTQP